LPEEQAVRLTASNHLSEAAASGANSDGASACEPFNEFEEGWRRPLRTRWLIGNSAGPRLHMSW
jgi:hypothetical protein